jgi:hypothetical protein
LNNPNVLGLSNLEKEHLFKKYPEKVEVQTNPAR